MKYEEGARFSVFDFKKDRGGEKNMQGRDKTYTPSRRSWHGRTWTVSPVPSQHDSFILLSAVLLDTTCPIRPSSSVVSRGNKEEKSPWEREKEKKEGWVREAGEDQWTKKVAYGVLQPPKVSQQRKRERRGGYLRLSSWTLTLLSYLMADR